MIYTYTKLIQGEALAFNICAALRESAKYDGDFEAAARYGAEADLHQENIQRYKHARALHGDGVQVYRRY